ncbi:hypothetical protein HOLleu_17381 [Holothuria leucospilota]|uniref:Uncharacterized protein n=1 Tax=Holothuria leucospilota TaxID=206669 RepID=A0A9Q1C7I4_HOLLE|nr:hypothetical protein HOLleu_17381 [Holothuria leucospilota]
MESDRTDSKNKKGFYDEIVKILAAYQRLLKEKPLLTKSISSGVIAGVGDVIAQKIVLKDSSPISLRQTGAFTLLGYVCAYFVGFVSY